MIGRRNLLRAAALVAVFSCLIAAPAASQRMVCGDADAIIAHLAERWGETPAAMALDAAGRMIRILVNRETGSWTAIVTGPGQPTCLLSHGTAWEPLPFARPRIPGDPS